MADKYLLAFILPTRISTIKILRHDCEYHRLAGREEKKIIKKSKLKESL